MRRLVMVLLLVVLVVSGFSQVYLNEIRANDAGTDDAQFIELIGPAGVDISGYKIIHHNGTGAGPIFTFTFPANTIFPDDGVTDLSGKPLGFIVLKKTGDNVPNFDFEWGSTNIQNGPDGIELQDAGGVRIQALTWNGLGSLSGGSPAWRNIGSDADDDNSLSAPSEVNENAKKLWSYVVATPGALNSNQVSGDLSLPVTFASFTASAGDGKVVLRWITESELNNLGFEVYRAEAPDDDYQLLSSYLSDPALQGQGNSNSRHSYSFTDPSVVNGTTYWYKLSDVDANGNRTFHGPVNATPNARAANIHLADPSLPHQFKMYPNYPNPFNPTTRIRFDLPASSAKIHRVSLTVYNLLGQEVAELFDGELEPGSYEVSWDGRTRNGLPAAAGAYIAVLHSDYLTKAIKMLLVK